MSNLNILCESTTISSDNKKIRGHYTNLNVINASRSRIYDGCVRFWNLWYFEHCESWGHSDDKDKLTQCYRDVLLKIETDADFQIDREISKFDQELRDLRSKMGSTDDGMERAWNYREMIYEATEQQIDVKRTKLPIDELWKLVDFQEKGDDENYEKLAHPKRWKFMQQQMEMMRRDLIKDNEKKRERQRRRTASKGSKKSMMNGAGRKRRDQNGRMGTLDEHEEDEDADIKEQHRFESTYNFAALGSGGADGGLDTPGIWQ